MLMLTRIHIHETSAIVQVLAGVQRAGHGRWYVSLPRSDTDGESRSVLRHERRCVWRLSTPGHAGIPPISGQHATLHYSWNRGMWPALREESGKLILTGRPTVQCSDHILKYC